MIKTIIFEYECPSCGTILNPRREIVIDEYLKKIEILKPKKCACGRKKGFKLLNCNIFDYFGNKEFEEIKDKLILKGILFKEGSEIKFVEILNLSKKEREFLRYFF